MTEWSALLKVSALVIPKRGSSVSECEDSVGVVRRRMRFCVADGATEAFDSRYWARLLTKSWSGQPTAVILQQQFVDWLPAVGDRFHSRWEGKSLPWYSEEKCIAGAFAAFTGLTFEYDGLSLRWAAAALGDSYLFRLSGEGALIDTLPDVAKLGSGFRPTLVPSRRSLQADALSHMLFASGDSSKGDVFFLLTDSIAAWYARMLDREPPLARHFDAMLRDSRQEEMESLIRCERERGTLQNDDIAAIRIQFMGEADDMSPPRAE
jgi:hypothetical protein